MTATSRRVEIATPMGTIVLVVPTSQRLLTPLIEPWLEHGLAKTPADASVAERRARAEHGDLAACAAVLQLATPEGPCPVLQRWSAGGYADDPNAAPNDLLTWCEENGVYASDLHAAVGHVLASCSTPTQALVEEARGNSRAPTPTQ